MGLQEQHFEVAFNSGADESQEDYATSTPISVLTDYEYRKDGGLRKRRGWRLLGTYDAGLGAAALVPNGSALGVIGRNTLTGVGASAIDADGSPRLQHTARVTSERFANIVDSADLQDCDVAYCTDGRVCVVATRYDGSAYSVVICVFNTDGVLLHREVVTSARRARVVAQGASRFNVYYTSTSSNVINVRSIIGDPTQGGTQSTTSSLVSNHATYKAYDVCAGAGSNAYLVYNEVTTGRMRIALISAACAVSANYDTALTTMDYPAIAYHPTTTHVHVAYANRGSTGGYLIEVNATPSSTLHGPTAVVAGVTVSRTAITPLLDATDSPIVAFFQDYAAFSVLADVYAVSMPDNYGGAATATHYQTQFTTAPFGVASGQFDTTAGSDRPYAGFFTGSPQDQHIPTAMLGMVAVGGYGTQLGGGTGLTYSPRSFGPVVPLVTDGAGTPVTDGTAARVPAGSGTVRYTAVPYIYDEADGTEHLAVLVLKLDTAPVPEPIAHLGGSAFVGGGVLRFYDGQRFGELTPATSPGYIDATTVGAGLSPAAGTYNYVGYVEWVDGNGDTHRGPVTTVPAPLTHAGGSITVTIRNNAPSLLDPSNTTQKWLFRLYRTQTGGSVFHFHSQKEITAADATITITDTSSDLTIADHEILYTDGGILQAESPPALKALVAHRNRLWGISAEDPHSLWPSKVKEDSIAVEFSSSLVRRVDADKPPVALASLDDKLLVFSAADTYAIVGDGPPSTGIESGAESWAPAEIVCPGLGATGPQAALTTPLGVIVHSTSGFKLLGRDLSPTDIGGALLDTAPGTLTVLRAINLPGRQQAWFLMSNGKVIVFDYARAHLRWSRFTVKNGSETPVDIAVLGDTPYVLTSGGKLYYMGTSAVDDDGTFVTASLTTGWMRPAGSLGEARFRILHLYGNRDTHSGVTATITTQGGEPQAAAPTSQAVTWTGTEMSKGGTPAHVRHRIKYQRGYAIRLTLTQVAGDAVDSGGFEPLMVGFEYGTHNRVGKTAATSNPG